MIKNFNWGHGITLFYIIFVCAVVSVLVASFSVDHDLVVDDYYAKDLTYQSTYEKLENNLQLDNLELSQDAEYLFLDFKGQGKVSGTIQFYRASDKSKDFILPLRNREKRIRTTDLALGKWQLKIDWKSGSESYYKEVIIHL